MPTREELASWLREAGRNDVALARMHGAGPGAESFYPLWEQRATQVEAMRCETCQHGYDFDYECRNLDTEIENCGPNDGCFHHEERK